LLPLTPTLSRKRERENLCKESWSSRPSDLNYVPMVRDSFMTRRARELRQEQTSAEKKVWRLLRDRRLGGLKFRRQHVIGNRVVDFVCLSARLVIEIDGDTHDDPDADSRCTAEIERAGYTVIRFWNSYVYDPESQILDMVVDALRESALSATEKARLDEEGLLPTAFNPSISC
jgi:very-short-patch-repair endonuclease